MSPLEAPPNGEGDPESQYSYWMMKIHPDWVVLNRGVNGERSDEILARFQNDVTQTKPEFVIILAGVNDIYQGVPLDGIKNNLRIMYETAIAGGIRAVAASVLPYNTATHQEAQAIIDLNSWIEAAGRRLGILFCDTNRAVADPENPSRLRGSPDENHPDVAGYRSIGEALAQTIATDITQRTSHSYRIAH
jgi:lysophospholipase L1-like esterase